MINIGVIGCGKIAQVRHLPEYAAHPEARIAGVFDLCQERAETIAETYHTKVYTSYKDMLADPEIEAVSVCVANAAHCEITVEALKSGKHVLCEKPMAVTLEQCEQMAQTAKQENRFLMIGHNQRLTKAHAKARKLVEQGEIGKILTFRTSLGHGGPETWPIDSINVWFFDKKTAAFGAMADLGIHKTDLIQYLTGQRVSAVTAYMGTLDKKDSEGNPIGVDDNAICIYEMDGGAVGTMTASWTHYGPEDNSTVLYGTKGIMYIYTDPEYAVVIEYKDGTREQWNLDQIQTNDSQTSSGVIDLWMESLVQHCPPEISGEEALSAMRAVFAALESAGTGSRVMV